MTEPGPSIPFYDDDFVYFELQSPHFRAFEVSDTGGTYLVQNFIPGIYRLPIDAIRPANERDTKERPGEIIRVDGCQIFIVDSSFYERLVERLDLRNCSNWQIYPYFTQLRQEIGLGFGHITVTSDGAYWLDLSFLERIDPNKPTKPKPSRSNDDLFEKVARRMGTFVCEACFNEELMGEGQGDKDLACLAQQQGWKLLPAEGERDRFFFAMFQILGPKCAAKRQTES